METSNDLTGTGENGVLGSALLLVTLHAAPPSSDYHLIRNVLLGGEGGWDYVTVDPDAKRIYIPRSEDIQVVDEISGKIIADITGMKGLHGVAVAPQFGRGFATGNDPDAEIYLLDLKALKVTGKLTPAGAKGSDSLAYDPVSKRAFINTAASNNAQVVDAASGRMVGARAKFLSSMNADDSRCLGYSFEDPGFGEPRHSNWTGGDDIWFSLLSRWLPSLLTQTASGHRPRVAGRSTWCSSG